VDVSSVIFVITYNDVVGVVRLTGAQFH